MAVTDLTDSLPWWARQGVGPNGEAPGGGVLGYPAASNGGPNMGNPAQSPQGGQDWLSYLYSMFGPSQAQAAEPPINSSTLARSPLGGQSAGPAPASAIQDSLTAGPSGPPTGAGLPDQSGIARGPNGVLSTAPSTPPVGASLPDLTGIPRYPNGVLSTAPNPANVAAPAAQPVSASAPPATPAAAAPTPGPMSNRFIGIDRPNADPLNRRGGPQGTALNLAGLFGGGQPAVNPNVAAPNAQPVSGTLNRGGPSAPTGPMAPSAIARLAQHAPGRMQMSPDQLATYMRNNNWLQNLGGPASSKPWWQGGALTPQNFPGSP